VHPTIDLYFVELPLYTALVVLGAVVGLLTAYLFLRWHSRRLARLPIFLDGALLVFVAGWIGARAYHVATHWDYYAARSDEIAQIGLGGLGIRGALIAGLIALALYAWARRGDRLVAPTFWRLADAAALGLAIGQAIGWAGALVQGANYGVVSDSRLALDLADLYGLVQPRFPLQHVEIVLLIGLWIGLLIGARRKPRAGALFLAYLLIASAANFALGFQRGDESVYIGALRVDQVVDAAFSGLACAGLWHRRSVRSPRPDRPAWENVG